MCSRWVEEGEGPVGALECQSVVIIEGFACVEVPVSGRHFGGRVPSVCEAFPRARLLLSMQGKYQRVHRRRTRVREDWGEVSVSEDAAVAGLNWR
jgi:hypothetical protein